MLRISTMGRILIMAVMCLFVLGIATLGFGLATNDDYSYVLLAIGSGLAIGSVLSGVIVGVPIVLDLYDY